jgi:hypothetical protein
MANYSFIVHATQGDNVGNVEANNKADALAKIKEVYAPDIGGKPHENVSFELITPQEFTTQKERIKTERKAEADKTGSDILASGNKS